MVHLRRSQGRSSSATTSPTWHARQPEEEGEVDTSPTTPQHSTQLSYVQERLKLKRSSPPNTDRTSVAVLRSLSRCDVPILGKTQQN